MKNYQASIKTPYAHLGLCVVDNRLAAIDFIELEDEIKPADADAASICDRIRRFLEDPLNRNCQKIPCSVSGTPFQIKVWNELSTIPAGKVVTYGAIAKKLGTSARAVGNACRSNPIPVVVPCHRVVSSAGKGGYAGHTGGDMVRFKAWLLEHEGVSIN